MSNWTEGNKYIDQSIDDDDRLLIMYNHAIELCEDPNVWYSQSNRGQTVGGIYYVDCSYFIDECLLEAGFDVKQWCKDNEGYKGMPPTGDFKQMLADLWWTEVDSSGEHKVCDIGVNYGTHTELCYEGGNHSGIFMGAHSSHSDHTKDVAIDSSNTTFNHLWRFGDGIFPEGNVFSFYVFAAIAGNFWVESTGISPTRWESGEVRDWTSTYYNNTGGYGIGQWTNTNGNSHGRLYKLYEYMTANDYSMDSGDGQAHYIPVEAAWSPKWTGHYDWSEQFPSFDSFMESESTDIDTLTHAWQNCWEVNTDSSTSSRQSRAHQAYDYVVENWNNEDIDDWITGNRVLDDDEALNNAVMLYRNLNSIYGGSLKLKNSGNGDVGSTNGNSTFGGNVGIATFEDFLLAMLGKKNRKLDLHIKNGIHDGGTKHDGLS